MKPRCAEGGLRWLPDRLSSRCSRLQPEGHTRGAAELCLSPLSLQGCGCPRRAMPPPGRAALAAYPGLRSHVGQKGVCCLATGGSPRRGSLLSAPGSRHPPAHSPSHAAGSPPPRPPPRPSPPFGPRWGFLPCPRPLRTPWHPGARDSTVPVFPEPRGTPDTVGSCRMAPGAQTAARSAPVR